MTPHQALDLLTLRALGADLPFVEHQETLRAKMVLAGLLAEIDERTAEKAKAAGDTPNG